MRVLAEPFFCQACHRRSLHPLSHRTLGYICQHCFQPIRPAKAKRKRQVIDVAVLVARRVANQTRLVKIAERDGWVCQLCGEPVEMGALGPHRPSLDHIIRRRDGGTRAMTNLRLTHQSCNEYREGANVVPFAVPRPVDAVRGQADGGVPSA